EFEIDAVEEIAIGGMRRDEQRPQLERIGIELLVLDRERQIEPDLPPVGEAIGEFGRAVDAVVRDQPAGKRRLLPAERDIIEMLLDGELTGLGDPGIVDLDFVGRRCRMCAERNERTREQPPSDAEGRHGYDAPIRMPTASTMTPPSTTWNTAFRN